MEAPDGLSKGGDVSSRSVGAEATSHFIRSLEPKGGTRHEISITAMVLMVVVVVMVKVMVVRSERNAAAPPEASTCATQAFPGTFPLQLATWQHGSQPLTKTCAVASWYSLGVAGLYF